MTASIPRFPVRLAVLLSVVGLSALRAQDAAPPTLDSVASISTASFAVRTDAEQPVAGWTFESVGYARDAGRRREVRVGPEGDASILVPEDGPGIVLRGAAETARGDLLSAPFRIEPFRWVEITIEYRLESGEPILFAGLRPTADRMLVDVEFAPLARTRKLQSATLRLHSGASEGPYSVAISIGGEGAVRVLSVAAAEAGEYRKPERPLLVLDIRTTEPSGRENENFARVASVFGFPSVEYMHWTEFDESELEAIDPALIVLPGLVSLQGADQQRMDSVVRRAVEHDAPVVGVCLGHQMLARAHGAQIRRGGAESGPTRIEVVQKDPLFDGLPRGRAFHASQSHRFEVERPVGKMQLLASSEACRSQVFRYRGKPWYTFQGHIERGWEVASPEGCLLWKNMLREWKLIER